MLPIHTIKRMLASLPPDFQEIVLELRNLVVEVAPGATERTHSKGFSYFFAERGGTVSAGICQIVIFSDHIRLAFNLGVFLPDPKGLLTGTTKAKRYLCIYSYEEADWDYYKQLMTAMAAFDIYTQPGK